MASETSDTYKGDSPGKKVIRALFWMSAMDHVGHRGKDARFLILPGREGSDVRTLMGFGVLEDQIVAVERSPDALEQFRSKYPGVESHLGDVSEVVVKKKMRRRFDVVHLDFCSPVSMRAINKITNTVRYSMRTEGLVGAGFMYGRESHKTRSDVKMWREDAKRLVEHVDGMFGKDTDGIRRIMDAMGNPVPEDIDLSIKPSRRDVNASVAFMARVNLIGNYMARSSLAKGFGIYSISHYKYQSVTRNNRGVPMIYFMGKLFRPNRPVSRKVLERKFDAAISKFDNNRTVSIPPGLGIDGSIEMNETQLKKLAIALALMHPSSVVAEILNLKTMTVAGWLAHYTRGSYDDDESFSNVDILTRCSNPDCKLSHNDGDMIEMINNGSVVSG